MIEQSPNNSNKQFKQILYLVEAKATFAEIAIALGISQGTLSTKLKTMEKQGLINREKVGRTLLLTIPHAIQNNLDYQKPIVYRIHNLWLTFPLKDSIGNDTTGLLLSKGIKLQSAKPLTNHTDSYFIQDGYEACLSPSSIQIHLPDMDGLPLEADLRSKAMELMVKVEDVLLKLEDRLGIKAKRIDRDTIIGRISQLHIALKNHEFAETVNERGEKLYVKVDDELRVVVDFSHGKHEYEAVHSQFSIPDAQKLGKLTTGVITDKFDYEKDHELLHGVIKAQARTQEQVERIATEAAILGKNVNIHEPFWESMNVVARHLTSPSPAARQRAAKAIEKVAEELEGNRSQKKLFNEGF